MGTSIHGGIGLCGGPSRDDSQESLIFFRRREDGKAINREVNKPGQARVAVPVPGAKGGLLFKVPTISLDDGGSE